VLEIRLSEDASFREKIASTRRKMSSKKGARKRPFAGSDVQHSLQILTLRELERLAGLGAAVLLRSTTRESRVRKPPFFRMPRKSGSK
jgi:hypothetical protein